MRLQPRYKSNARTASLRTRVRLGQAARSARVRRDAVRVPVRLSRNVTPLKYTLKLKPDLETFVFEGEETIRLRIKKGTRSITLHSKELSIDLAEIIRGKEKEFALKTTYDEKADTATFIFRKRIPKGTADLRLVFRGTLNDKMHGFYRSRYEVNGETRHMATTQFEATDARRAFPCFDEPAMKAVFHVTLVIPKDKTAISNTIPSIVQEHEDGRKSVVFAPTPKMSTYLLAFIAGDFEHIEKKTKEGVLVRVFTTPGKIHQAEFALSCAAKALSFFDDYFKIPYPLPTLDIIATPDFTHVAMENWGAVTFRESALLVDPDHSSVENRQWVALVIAHELAHQWFGNLVTMEWWTHLWLNEGFATYIEYLAVDHLFPEWDIWTQFVNRESSIALKADALLHTHPIEIDVHHPEEIDEAFDKEISYGKGASIIRMLADYLGEKKFRDGLRFHLKKHSYANTSTVHLWNAFERASGKPVRTIMNNWTRKPGYPILTLSETEKGLMARQERFFSNPLSESRLRDKTLWQVPFTIRTSNKKITALTKRRIIHISHPNTSWIKTNADETGFFLTHYPGRTLQALEQPIREKNLNALDRLGIIRNVAALAQNGRYTSEDLLRTALYYKNETDFTVWSELISNLNQVASLVAHEPFKRKYDELVRELLALTALKIGWRNKKKESHTDFLLRGLILLHFGIYGDTDTIAHAKKMFARIKEHANTIHPDLRETVYGIVARYGGTKEHEKLLRMYMHAKLDEEKNRIGAALAAFRDKALLRKTLEFSLSRHVRSQDTTGIVTRVAVNPEGRLLAWTFMKRRWNIFLGRYRGGPNLSRLIASLGTSVSKDAARNIGQFFKTHSAPAAERTIEQTIEKIESNAARLAREKATLAKLFTRKVPLSSRTLNPTRTNRRRS